MTSRFISNLVATVAGGLLTIVSLTFGPEALGWLALGLAATVLSTTLIAFVFRGRGAVQRTLDVTTAAVSGWTVLAACTFAGASLRWLSFAGGAALWTLGVIGLIVHETLMERPFRPFATAETAQDGLAPRSAPTPTTTTPVRAA